MKFFAETDRDSNRKRESEDEATWDGAQKFFPKLQDLPSKACLHEISPYNRSLVLVHCCLFSRESSKCCGKWTRNETKNLPQSHLLLFGEPYSSAPTVETTRLCVPDRSPNSRL